MTLIAKRFRHGFLTVVVYFKIQRKQHQFEYYLDLYLTKLFVCVFSYSLLVIRFTLSALRYFILVHLLHIKVLDESCMFPDFDFSITLVNLG